MENKNTFENLEIWKESMNLCVQIYELMKNSKDFGFKDQIQRAAVSVPSNIAEGFERQTNKEFIQFLFIAKGSCGEVRTQLYLAKALKYIDNEIVNNLIERTGILSSKIQNFIKYRRA
ncbi:MAG: four helix bundle protein [Bacteroidales bacterium]|jgi:four helix bundle protein|nr:four helix bundle protein [Bacteroidales bacterium]